MTKENIIPIKTERINREVIHPAKKREILLFLLTQGRRGALWKIVVEPAIRYFSTTDVRCRCVIKRVEK